MSSPPLIDKSSWPPGPWHDEPDWASFRAHGLECEVVRHYRGGHLCGYVYCIHDVPYKLLPEDITYGTGAVYGFDCGPVSNYRPGTDDPLGEPLAYCTFAEMRRRVTALAKALECESVWWRRARRQLAQVLRVQLRDWPKEHP